MTQVASTPPAATIPARWRQLLQPLVIPALAILTALIAGSLVIVLTDLAVLAALKNIFAAPGAAFSAMWKAIITAYGSLFEGSIGSPTEIIAALRSGDQKALVQAFYPISDSLVTATPYIFAGLAVAVGFRCGLFNIGVEGQLFIGAICSVWVGFTFKGLPSIVHIPLALLAGAAGGAAWASIPAILKAKTGAHEVINTIMMNYIAFRLSDWLLGDKGPLKRPDSANPVSPFIEKSAELPRFFPDPIRFHLGFFIALAVAVVGGLAQPARETGVRRPPPVAGDRQPGP